MNLDSRVGVKDNLVLGNIRELDRVPVTECLPYIHLANSLYYKKHIYYILLIYDITLSF